jgi:hypothetical protein
MMAALLLLLLSSSCKNLAHYSNILEVIRMKREIIAYLDTEGAIVRQGA